MKTFGPTRGELVFRLCFSVIGLALMAAALFYRGIPSGPALFEVGIMAGAFFGGTAIWCIWKLLREPGS